MSEIDKDAFMATVVHDMRAPLNACLMSLSLVELKASDPAEVMRSVDVIRRNLERQAALIGDLGDALQIVGGGLRLDSERIDLAGVVEAGADAAQLPDGVEIDRQLCGETPLMADRERLARAVETLVESVGTSASAGDRVVVSVAVDGNTARIAAVRAGAAGGERGARRKRPAMRLSVAEQIVAMHGGRMAVDEESGAIELSLSS